MLLEYLSDIDQGEISQELEVFARKYGIMNMLHVHLIIQEFLQADNKKVLFVISEENAYEMIRKMIALAIINHASAVYEDFQLPDMNPDLNACFSRKHDIATYEKTRDQFLKQIRILTQKYPESLF